MALLPHLPEVSFVEVGDFTGAALRRCVEHGVPEVVFVGMIGKLTKLAAGILMTHYTRSRWTRSARGHHDTRVCRPEHWPLAYGKLIPHGTYTSSGMVPAFCPCADALCRQVARVLERFAQVECGGSPAGPGGAGRLHRNGDGRLECGMGRACGDARAWVN